jgi:hypothetical protein
MTIHSLENFMFKNMKEGYTNLCRKIGASLLCPSARQAQVVLFVFGIGILALGLTEAASAQFNQGGIIRYNDQRIVNAVNAIMTYLEGTFGALVMAAAGIGAILAAAFGNYKAALSLMVVAVGAFILRSVMATFFNDQNIQS